jgi:hypothetical protein
LKIASAEDDEFVKTMGHSTSYVDVDYFIDYMHEDEQDPDFLTFPVKVQACRVDWILMSDTGINFLRALLKTPNISVFKTSYV